MGSKEPLQARYFVISASSRAREPGHAVVALQLVIETDQRLCMVVIVTGTNGPQMPNQPPVPYYYAIELQDPSKVVGGNSLTYVMQDGQLVASVLGIVLENGKWVESEPFSTNVSQEAFGEGGTRIAFETWVEGPQMDPETTVYLAFEVPVNFAEPLPLDRLSLDHCLVSFTQLNVGGSSPVLSVKRVQAPPPVSVG